MDEGRAQEKTRPLRATLQENQRGAFRVSATGRRARGRWRRGLLFAAERFQEFLEVVDFLLCCVDGLLLGGDGGLFRVDFSLTLLVLGIIRSAVKLRGVQIVFALGNIKIRFHAVELLLGVFEIA